jgi:hypothetical protein
VSRPLYAVVTKVGIECQSMLFPGCKREKAVRGNRWFSKCAPLFGQMGFVWYWVSTCLCDIVIRKK